MNPEAMWLIILAAATPIAGIVGFAIQFRTVKKVRLENKKLALEIANLERALEASKSQIIIPTNREVAKILYGSDILFSRRNPSESLAIGAKSGLPWREWLLLFVAAIVAFYLLYDLFRLGRWLYELF